MKHSIGSKKVLFLDNYVPDHGFYEETLHISGQKQRERQHERAKNFTQCFFQTSDIHLEFIQMENISQKKLENRLSETDIDLIIISGSPFNIEDQEECPWISQQIEAFRYFYKSGFCTPVIGICFGYHVLATAFGGTLKKTQTYYYDIAEMLYIDGEKVRIARCHEWYVSELPPDIPATILAYSQEKEGGKQMPYQIVYDADGRKIFATLLHPEIPDEKENINTEAIDRIRRFF